MKRCSVLVVPATDWLRGPQSRLHRLFEGRLRGEFGSEVMHIPSGGATGKRSQTGVFSPRCFPINGSIGLFYLVNLVVLWIALVRRIAERRPRVVVSTNPIMILPLTFLRNSLGVRVLFDYVDCFSDLVTQYVPRVLRSPVAAVMERIVERVLHNSSRVIVSSKVLETHTQEVTGKSPILVPNGVDIQLFKNAKVPRKEAPVVGYVGGVYEWAGVDDFIETYEQVSLEIRNVEYHIYGVGTHSERVSSLAARWKNVHYHGEIPYADVPSVMKSFDVAVIPFRRNRLTDAACPLKLFEYWAADTCVVSRKLLEIANVSNSAVLYFDDVVSFSKQIVRALKSPKESASLRRRASAIVQKYDWNALSERYRDVIRAECESY